MIGASRRRSIGYNIATISLQDRPTISLQYPQDAAHIVWNTKLWANQLITCSYDCTLALIDTKNDFQMIKFIQGPFTWADALATDYQGRFLVTQDDNDYSLLIWDLRQIIQSENPYESQPDFTLKGHTDEINSIRLYYPLAVSGGSDKTCRLWDLESKASLRVLTGPEGKIWSVDMNRDEAFER